MGKYTILLPYFKEKCYFEYMKKILLFASLLLVCSCNGSISGSKSLSSRGRLLSITENVSYYIKYDTRTYEVIIEFDYEKHEVVKTESVDYSNVYFLPRDRENHRERRNEYLVYEYQKDLIIYELN